MATWKYAKTGRGNRRSVKARAGKRGTVTRRGYATRRAFRRLPPRPLVSRYLVSPFPKTRICRHRYVETVTLPAGSGVGVTAQYVFRANGIFDPNFTGTGHQPLYRDEMAARYTNYCVLNAYITVVFDQSATQQKHYGIYLQDSTGALQSDPTTVCEQYGTRGPIIGSQRNSPLILKKTFDAVREMRTGSVKQLMSDDTYKTPVGSDPSSSKVVRYFIIL